MAREGLLTPGRSYYWRVRARSKEMLWGPWSPTWSFVPQGPGIPQRVRLEANRPNGFTLKWDPDPGGRPAVRYRVYASDQKGFPASDEPYRAPAGNQKERGLFPGEKVHLFPANLLAEVSVPSLELTPRHAFYRVVAVDETGSRSGSSDYAAAPRPFIWSDPPRSIRAGEPYRYDPKTIASIGDLTYRDFGPGQSYQAAYWDPDEPVWSLEAEMPRCANFDPRWLRIDPRTGTVSGLPSTADAGEYQINMGVRIGRSAFVQSYSLTVTR